MKGNRQRRLLAGSPNFRTPHPVIARGRWFFSPNGAPVNRDLPAHSRPRHRSYPQNLNWSAMRKGPKPVAGRWSCTFASPGQVFRSHRPGSPGASSKTSTERRRAKPPALLLSGAAVSSSARPGFIAASTALPRSARQQTRRRILATARQSQPARRRRCSQQQQHLCGPLRVSHPRARQWVARYVVLVGRDVGSASERKVKRMGRNPAP